MGPFVIGPKKEKLHHGSRIGYVQKAMFGDAVTPSPSMITRAFFAEIYVVLLEYHPISESGQCSALIICTLFALVC